MNIERLKEIREELNGLYKTRNNREYILARLKVSVDKNFNQIQMVNTELANIALKIRLLKTEQALLQTPPENEVEQKFLRERMIR
jgi:hypothetical protein